MKLEIKPLTEFQHSDEMVEKCIQQFRLPSTFLGCAEDYNRAVAEASLRYFLNMLDKQYS